MSRRKRVRVHGHGENVNEHGKINHYFSSSENVECEETAQRKDYLCTLTMKNSSCELLDASESGKTYWNHTKMHGINFLKNYITFTTYTGDPNSNSELEILQANILGKTIDTNDNIDKSGEIKITDVSNTDVFEKSIVQETARSLFSPDNHDKSGILLFLYLK